MGATVQVRCVSCGNVWSVKAGDVKPGDMPACKKCYSFGVAVSAKGKP